MVYTFIRQCVCVVKLAKISTLPSLVTYFLHYSLPVLNFHPCVSNGNISNIFETHCSANYVLTFDLDSFIFKTIPLVAPISARREQRRCAHYSCIEIGESRCVPLQARVKVFLYIFERIMRNQESS